MFGRKRNAWTDEADVVIVGSGGAGLTAAILAHDPNIPAQGCARTIRKRAFYYMV